jgi:tetratricopeptide (TPR) repeat protein
VAEHSALLSEHSFFGGRFAAALEYSRSAGDRARAVYANADAAELYRRALASSDRLPSVSAAEFVSLCESLGSVYDDLGEFERAEQVLVRARARAADDALRVASVELHMGIIRQRMGRPSLALRGLSRGLKALEGREDDEASKLRAALMTRYAWTRNFQGKTGEVIRWASRGIEEANACGEESLVAQCFEAMEWAWMGAGRIPEDSPALKALATYEALEDLAGQASTLNTLGAREYYLGNWNEALDYYERSLQAYRACGTSWGTVVPMASQAEVLCDQGRIELAEPIALEALRIVRGANMPNDIAFVRSLLGRIAVQQERYDEALAYYEAAEQYYQAAGFTSLLLQTRGYIAECYLLQGQSDRALEMVTAARGAAAGLEGAEFVMPLLERVRGVTLARSGQREEGVNVLRACLDQARARKALPDMAWVLRDLTTLAGDDAAASEGWTSELQVLQDRLGLSVRA